MFKPFEFCIPTKGIPVPSGPKYVHEAKVDGYRLRAERNGGGSVVNNVESFASRLLASQQVGSAEPPSYVSNPLGLPRKSTKISRSFVTGFRARSAAAPTPGKLA
jgi:hypothetical protein